MRILKNSRLKNSYLRFLDDYCQVAMLIKGNKAEITISAKPDFVGFSANMVGVSTAELVRLVSP